MSQAKRKHDDEPSTSSGSGSNTKRNKLVPGRYVYHDTDEEKDFSDSGSEWEASPSEMASYIADGGQSFTAIVNTSGNSAIDPSIRNASITENSEGRHASMENNGDNDPLLLMHVVTTADMLGETANSSHNSTAVSADADNNSTQKRAWTLNEIRENERAGLTFSIARRTTVRQSGKVTSEVWNFFDIVGVKLNGKEIITDFAKCKQCSSFVKFYGSTTTQLKRHKCDGDGQPKIDEMLGTRANVTISKDDLLMIRDAAAQFVSLDIRPFFAVEGEGMKKFLLAVAKVARKYKLVADKDLEGLIPNRFAVTRHVMSKSMQAKAMIIDDFQRALQCPGGFSCTTDLYTDCFKSRSYLGITASLNLLENGKIKQKRYVVNLDALNVVNKSGENIFKAIKECLSSFQITETQIIEQITWVTDRGSNIIGALEKCKRMNCYSHIINNIVKYMCEKEPDVKKMITNGSSLVRYMKLASLDNTKLKRTLKPYVETRWNTVNFMFDSIVFNYAEIYQALSEKENSSSIHRNVTEKITCLSKHVLENICEFLKVFTDISIQLEGDKYETIHRVWPAYMKIKSHLQEKHSDSPIIIKMKVLGRKYIADHIDGIKPDMEHKIAVFLHPLLKQLNNVDDSEKEIIISHIKAKMPEPEEVLQNEAVLDLNSNHHQHGTNGNHPELINSTESTSGLQLFNDFLMNDADSFIQTDEIQKYIDFSVEKTPFDLFNLLQWWEQHQLIFPWLFKLFLRTYATPASSASSERAFSTTGRTLDARRSSLKPSTINQLMLSREFYRHNAEK